MTVWNGMRYVSVVRPDTIDSDTIDSLGFGLLLPPAEQGEGEAGEGEGAAAAAL